MVIGRRRFSVVLDPANGWPIYFQRSAPGVYHLWVWPLCFQALSRLSA